MNPENPAVIDVLLNSEEPSIRWKVRVQVLGESPDSRAIRDLRESVRESPRARALIEGADLDHVYDKWHGAHWVLASLADLGYPEGDEVLAPLRDRVEDFWLGPQYFREVEASTVSASYAIKDAVPILAGRHRRCGSQQGNALRYLTVLGLADDRTPQLAERLLHWQWPDGGWNCDRNPDADTSSFMETLLPMCGLHVHAQVSGDAQAALAATRAADVFLQRRLYKRRSDGSVIHREFTRLHFPLYWHYDILAGLKAMDLLGCIADERCTDSLDLLESKRLADGGWPAEAKYYNPPNAPRSHELVDWGGTAAKRMNPWVTADALAVLRAADRL